jgi:hypothetical protein
MNCKAPLPDIQKPRHHVGDKSTRFNESSGEEKICKKVAKSVSFTRSHHL